MAEAGGRGLFRRRAGALAATPAFRLLFAAAAQPMALLGADGALQESNAALRRLAGPALAPRPGTRLASLLAPAGQEALRAALAALAGGAAEQLLEAPPADPTAAAEALWSLHLRPLGGPGDASAPLLLQVSDETARRQAEARLASAARLETVGRLAGGIAHDFNNLLTAMLGSLEAARQAGLSKAAAGELAAAEDAARRGAGLVRQLLAFARQQALQPQVVALNEAVRSITPLLQRLLGQAVGLELVLEEPGRSILVDPGQLDQVILNLAVNARDAMPGGGRLRLATGHAVVLRPEGERQGGANLPPGRYAVLEVADSGRGIPPEDLPHIFEPFFTTRIERGGTGLGLATVQGIVAQSGGHVAVESAPGRGTCFRLFFPRHEGRDAVPAVPGLSAPLPTLLPTPLPPAAGPVLLVEDEAPLRLLAERTLRRAGHAVLATDSAEAALARLEGQGMPAALVSDVAMPGMDGLALARLLRDRWPRLPVLLLSGYARSVLEADPEARAMRFLAKPYSPAELVAAMAELLAGPVQSAA